jgi:hypothetical protein
MELQTKITPTSELVWFLSDQMSKASYSIALLNGGDQLDFELTGNGYERAVLSNVMVQQIAGRVVLVADPIVFYCKGDGCSADRLAIVLNSGSGKDPIIGKAVIAVTMYDGDKLVLDLSKGFFDLTLG